MTYRLTSIDPPKIVAESPVAGYPVSRSVGDPSSWSAPEGCRYLPVVEQDRPAYDPETQQLKRLPDAIVADEIHAGRYEVVDRVPVVPDEVSRRQLFLVLLSLDPPLTRAAIRGMLVGNESALVEFDEAQTFKRDHPLVLSLAQQLGMTSEQVDALFIDAAKL